MQAQQMLRESVDKTALRLSNAHRKNFRHSEAALRLAVSAANRLRANPEATVAQLLEALANVEAEAQLLAIPTGVQELQRDVQMLRELIVSYQAEKVDAVANEACALRDRLSRDLSGRQLDDQDMQKVAADLSLLACQLERLLHSEFSSADTVTETRLGARERANTIAVPVADPIGINSNDDSATASWPTMLASKSSAGSTARPGSAALGGSWGNMERKKSLNASAPLQKPCVDLPAPESVTRPASAEQSPSCSSQAVGKPTVGPILRDLCGMEQGSDFPSGETPSSEKEPRRELQMIHVGADSETGQPGGLSDSPIGGTPPAEKAGQSFVLQEWESPTAAARADQLRQLASDACALAAAQREVAAMVEAAGDDFDQIEKEVAETVDNTSKAVDELVKADKSRTAGWTVKTACPSAIVGAGIGFCVGGPIGAAIVGGGAGIIGAVSGKAAKWRHNSRVDGIQHDKDKMLERRRHSRRYLGTR
jgi:hypothetical protein